MKWAISPIPPILSKPTISPNGWFGWNGPFHPNHPFYPNQQFRPMGDSDEMGHFTQTTHFIQTNNFTLTTHFIQTNNFTPWEIRVKWAISPKPPILSKPTFHPPENVVNNFCHKGCIKCHKWCEIHFKSYYDRFSTFSTLVDLWFCFLSIYKHF